MAEKSFKYVIVGGGVAAVSSLIIWKSSLRSILALWCCIFWLLYPEAPTLRWWWIWVSALRCNWMSSQCFSDLMLVILLISCCEDHRALNKILPSCVWPPWLSARSFSNLKMERVEILSRGYLLPSVVEDRIWCFKSLAGWMTLCSPE